MILAVLYIEDRIKYILKYEKGTKHLDESLCI